MPPLAIDVRAATKTFHSIWRGRRAALGGIYLAVPRGSCFGLLGPSGSGKSTLIGILASRIRPDSGTISVQPGAACVAGNALKRLAATWPLPDLLLLDEPMQKLNPAGRREAFASIQRIHSSGATILIASRDLASIEPVACDLAILHQGIVVASGKMADLRAARGCRVLVAGLPGRLSDELAAAGYLIGQNARQSWVASPDRSRLNALIDRLRSSSVSIEGVEELLPTIERVYLSAAAEASSTRK